MNSQCAFCKELTIYEVVRVPGYRSRGPGYDSRLLERGPLSLVRTIEELLD
jgi:hypothetical protein